MGNKFYSFAWYLSNTVYPIIFPHKVCGKENIPESGAYIVVANHISARDPLFLASALPRKRPIHFMAKKQLFENPILRKFMQWLHAFPVDRGNADMSAIHASMNVLKDGEILGIFPQGTRSKDNTPTPMLSGTSLIALRANAPVIPAYIDGPYRLFRRSNIYIGKPIDFSEFGRRCDRDTLENATHLIEKSVWTLKPADQK